MKIKAIIFDLDDTLYEEKDYVISGFRAVDIFIQDRYKVKGFFEIAKSLFNSGERKVIFNRSLELLNIDYDDESIEELINCYRSHLPDIHLLEDAKSVLDLIADDVKVGLLSDGYLIAQRQKISALNLIEKMHTIVLSDEFGRGNWKPSQFIYEKVSNQLQLSPDVCMYVGDNVSKDFITANRLGWTTVHIDRQQGIYSHSNVAEEYAAHYRIDDLRTLCEISVFNHLFKKEVNRIYGN